MYRKLLVDNDNFYIWVPPKINFSCLFANIYRNLINANWLSELNVSLTMYLQLLNYSLNMSIK